MAICLIFQLSGLNVYAGDSYGYIGSWNLTDDGVADASKMFKEIMGVGDYIEVADYIEIEPDKNSGKVKQIQGWVVSQNADTADPSYLYSGTD